MKKHFPKLLAIIALYTLTLCSKPGDKDPPTLSVAPLNQTVNSAPGITTFDIVSNTSWAAQSNQTWCTVLNGGGTGNATLSIKFEANTSKNQRVAAIAITGNGLATKTVTVTQQAVLPSEGLVAYYPFNGNANDVSGTGNNGVVNGATLTMDRKGNINSAYNFDGNSSFIEVPNNATLNPSSITISLWVKLNSYSHSGNVQIQSLIFKRNTRTDYFEGYQIRLESGSNVICSSVASCSGTEIGACNNDITGLSQWDHLVMTADASQMNFYVNGTLKSSMSVGFQLCYDNLPLYFGRTNQSQFEGFLNGVLDDIRIYNRTLSKSEIQQLYNEQ